MEKVPSGVYPVMITPYTTEHAIDYDAVDRIVEFYARSGCQGIFAVCQSSEMFYLSEDERAELSARVVQAAAGRMCVVASGHTSDAMEDQIRELSRIDASGARAVVLLSNRLATAEEDDDILIRRMNHILASLPGVVFGMYECPYPYKRLLSDKVLCAMAESGRFAFIKDTCCDAPRIARRIELLDGRIQLFNANSATLLDSMRHGADGFSGVMANMHPDLFVWLIANYQRRPEAAEKLSALLSILSGVERGYYPVSAKYHMNKVHVPMSLYSRALDEAGFHALHRREIDDLVTVEEMARSLLEAL